MRNAIIISCCVLYASCTNNLVKNPGAEDKDFTANWTIAEGRWMQRAKAPAPQEGAAYFFPGVAKHAELYQDVPVKSYSFLIDLGVLQMDYAAYVRAFPQRPPDECYEVVEFRNEAGSIIDSFASMHYDSTAAWIKITDNRKIPADTKVIRVRLLSERHNGSNNDGYHDNISLRLHINYLFYLLVLLAVILLVAIAIKRNKKKPKRLAAN